MERTRIKVSKYLTSQDVHPFTYLRNISPSALLIAVFLTYFSAMTIHQEKNIQEYVPGILRQEQTQRHL